MIVVRRETASVSCPGRLQRAHLRERKESRDPAQQLRSAAKLLLEILRVALGEPSCRPWVPGLASLARDTKAAASSARA